MCVETKWKNGRVTTAYASSFGFTPLNMKNKTKYEEQAPENMPKDLEYGSVSTGVTGMWNLSSIKSGGFTINGTAANNPWKYNWLVSDNLLVFKVILLHWLVSDYLNLAECPEPDSGVKVKDISLDLESYSYTYNQVGTYTATFLMNNANYSHVASKTCELIINVTE